VLKYHKERMVKVNCESGLAEKSYATTKDHKVYLVSDATIDYFQVYNLPELIFEDSGICSKFPMQDKHHWETHKMMPELDYLRELE